jgi:hypothetical protein
MKRITIATITCLFLSITSLSQATAETLKQKAKDLKLKNIVVRYDKFKDETYVFSKPENMMTGPESMAAMMAGAIAGPYGMGTSGFPTMLMMMVGYSFKGNEPPARPNFYTMMFVSNSNNGWVERLEYDAIDRDWDINMAGISEKMGFTIPREDLERIMRAKSIELKLGPLPRKFKNDEIKKVNEVLKLNP